MTSTEESLGQDTAKGGDGFVEVEQPAAVRSQVALLPEQGGKGKSSLTTFGAPPSLPSTSKSFLSLPFNFALPRFGWFGSSDTSSSSSSLHTNNGYSEGNSVSSSSDSSNGIDSNKNKSDEGLISGDPAASNKFSKSSSLPTRRSFSATSVSSLSPSLAVSNSSSTADSPTRFDDASARNQRNYEPSSSTTRRQRKITGSETTIKSSDMRSFNSLLKRLLAMRDSNEDEDRSHWMPDSTAYECYECSAMFTTFRRRHHCRLCGQIFCGKCSSLLVSTQFIGRPGLMRVCAYCEKVVKDYAESKGLAHREAHTHLERPVNHLSTPNAYDDALTAAARRLLSSSQALLSLPMSIVMRWGDPAVQDEAVLLACAPSVQAPFRHDEFSSANPASELSTPNGLRSFDASSIAPIGSRSEIQQEWVNIDDYELPFAPESSSEALASIRPSGTSRQRRPRPLLSFTVPPYKEGGLLYQPPTESTSSLPPDQVADNSQPAPPSSVSPAQFSLFPSTHSMAETEGIYPFSFSVLIYLLIINTELSKPKPDLSKPMLPLFQLKPPVEAYLQKMMKQVLRYAHLDVDVWGNIVLQLAHNVCRNLKLDVRQGDNMDVRQYVRIKKLPGGPRSDCQYIDGVVFSKSLAHKKMSSDIKKPKVLMLSFGIEYQRNNNQLVSIDPVLMQEKQYLKILVSRIQTLKPSIVLVEKSVSRIAQEYLLEAGISLALNVKSSVMADVARATETELLTSVDKLGFNPQLGTCGRFVIRNYTLDNESVTVSKSLIHFEGCNPKLFGTILLRGAPYEELTRLKQALYFVIYAAYSMYLESALMDDQFVSSSSLTEVDSSSIVSADILPASGFKFDEAEILSLPVELQQRINAYRHSLLSVSPSIHFPLPYALSRLIALEARKIRKRGSIMSVGSIADNESFDSPVINEAADGQEGSMFEAPATLASDLLDPRKRQTLVILFTIFCVGVSKPCKYPQTLPINFYSQNDMTLGQYVEELCFNTRYNCPSCEKQMLVHQRSYVHYNGRVTVSMEERLCPVPGGADTILMWSVCRECSKVTPLVTMSEDTWKFSVGKYLEMAFYDTSSVTKLEDCKHAIMRDHIRYFALHNMVVMFEWEQVQRLEIVAPPLRLKINDSIFDKMRMNQVEEIQTSISKFYASLHSVLETFPNLPVRRGRERLFEDTIQLALRRAGEEQQALLDRLDQLQMEPSRDTIRLNVILKALHERSFGWRMVFVEMAKLFLQENNVSNNNRSENNSAQSGPEVIPRRPRSPTDPLGFPASYRDKPVPPLPTRRSPSPNRRPHSPTDPLGFPADYPAQFKQFEAPISSDLHLPPLPLLDANEHEIQTNREGENDKLSRPHSRVTSAANEDALHSGHTRSSSESGSHKLPAASSEPEEQKRHRRMKSEVAAQQQAKDFEYTEAGQDIDRPSSAFSPKYAHGRELSMEEPFDITETGPLSLLLMAPSGPEWSFLASELSEQSPPAKAIGSQQRGSHVLVIESEEYEADTDMLVDESHTDSPQNSSACEDQEAGDGDLKSNTSASFASIDKLSSKASGSRIGLVEAPTGSPQTPLSKKLRAIKRSSNSDGQMRGDDSDDQVDNHSSNPNAYTDHPESESSHDDHGPRLPSSLASQKQRSTLMRTLTSFWNSDNAETSPTLSSVFSSEEHVFAESLVVVRENQPSSIIAFCLSSIEYARNKEALLVEAIQPEVSEIADRTSMSRTSESAESYVQINLNSLELLLIKKQETHIKYQFFEGPTQFYCKVYFVQQFDALREQCGAAPIFVSSLANCAKWDPKGGKSGSSFCITLDGRFVVKQMSRSEMIAFLKFAPSYFQYMSRALFNNSPSVLAKIFGVYQIAFRNSVSGRSFKQDVLVMENLFYDRKPTRIFDLKGSVRSRYAHTTGQENDVLLDENLLEALHSSPLYVHEHSKRALERAIANDTSFLADLNVIDYSLLVGLEAPTGELVVGIVDYIRTYTWDKKLESWVKETGLLGGGGKEPTILSPKQYKARFRQSMSDYFHVVADK